MTSNVETERKPVRGPAVNRVLTGANPVGHPKPFDLRERAMKVASDYAGKVFDEAITQILIGANVPRQAKESPKLFGGVRFPGHLPEQGGNVNKDELYIGTKFIKAHPATNDAGDIGYTVKYPDGYVSWSPKAVFESAYRRVTDAERAMVIFAE